MLENIDLNVYLYYSIDLSKESVTWSVLEKIIWLVSGEQHMSLSL